MGRFYKTSGGQFRDFMYQPDMETAKMAVDAEIKNEAIKQQFSKVEGLQQRNLLQGYTDDYNEHVTGFNESLKGAISEYQKTGDKSHLDNVIKQGKTDFGRESVYGKERYKSEAVFAEVAAAQERIKKLEGNAKAAAENDIQRYLDGEQTLSTKQSAEEFEPKTYKDYVDQQAYLDKNFNADLLTDSYTYENMDITGLYETVENADGTTSNKKLAKLPVGFRPALNPDGTITIVDADNKPAPQYGATTAVQFTPALNTAYQGLKTTNKFKGINLPLALNWAYQQNMDSPGWIANERQTYDLKRNLNGGFIKLEDVKDENLLENYNSAKTKRLDDKEAKLTADEETALNTIVENEKEYLDRRAAQEAKIFLADKKGVTKSTTTTLHDAKVVKDSTGKNGNSSGRTPEEIKENMNFVFESIQKDPTITSQEILKLIGKDINTLNDNYTNGIKEGEELVTKKQELEKALKVEGLEPLEKTELQNQYNEVQNQIRQNKAQTKKDLQLKNDVTNMVYLANNRLDKELKKSINSAEGEDQEDLVMMQNFINSYRDVNGDIINPIEEGPQGLEKSLEDLVFKDDTKLIEKILDCTKEGNSCTTKEIMLSHKLNNALQGGKLLETLKNDGHIVEYKGNRFLYPKTVSMEDALSASPGIIPKDLKVFQDSLKPLKEALSEYRDLVESSKEEYEDISYLHDKDEEFAEDLEFEKTSEKTVIDIQKTRDQGTKESKEFINWAEKTLLSDIKGGDGQNITLTNPGEDDPDNTAISFLTNDTNEESAEILFMDLNNNGQVEATANINGRTVRFTYDSSKLPGKTTTQKIVEGIEKFNKDQLDINSANVLSSVTDVKSYRSRIDENTQKYATDKYGNIIYDNTTAYTTALKEFDDTLNNIAIGGHFASAQGEFIYFSKRNDGDTWSTTVLKNDKVAQQGIVDLQELNNLDAEQIKALEVDNPDLSLAALSGLPTAELAGWLAKDQVNYAKAQEEARIKALNNKNNTAHKPKKGQTIYNDNFSETSVKDYYGNNVEVNTKILPNFNQVVAALKQDNIALKITDSHVAKDVKIAAKKEYDKQLIEFKEKGYYTKKNGQVVKAAPPQQAGIKSFHTHGQAVDLNQEEYDPNSEEFKKVAKAFVDAGFKQHPGEWWHWSIGEFS